MMMFLAYFLVTLLILVIAWVVSKGITWKEAATQLLVQSFFIAALCLGIRNFGLGDHEIINGRIISKHREEVHCRHSYSCPPCWTTCSGSKNRVCTRHCSTCYEHRFDVDWYAKDNVKRTFDISTIDRQGIKEPPRWTIIYVGEPTSGAHHYENYLKADPESLFHYEMGEEELSKYPTYPDKVYDYYRLNRLVGTKDSDLTKAISEVNADIGPARGANLVVVALTGKGRDYANKLQRAWLGGKKNDIVLVVGMNGAIIEWAEVVGISYPDFKVGLRNLVEGRELAPTLMYEVKSLVMSSFVRRPMSEFQYLKDQYKPTIGEWIFGFIVSILLSSGLAYFFHRNDAFGEEIRKYDFRY